MLPFALNVNVLFGQPREPFKITPLAGAFIFKPAESTYIVAVAGPNVSVKVKVGWGP